MVLYETPSMGGLTAAISYSSNIDDKRDGETGFATADNTRAVTAGLRYLNGPLAAFLSYDQLNGSNKLSQPSERNATPRSYLIGASYDFEVVKLLLAYGRTTDGWFGGSSLPAGARSANSAAYQPTPSSTASSPTRTWQAFQRRSARPAACSRPGSAPTRTIRA